MQERTALDEQLTAIGADRAGARRSSHADRARREPRTIRRTIAEAEAALRKLKAEVARRELEALLSGEADANDCYLEVHAGAGGTESQDWANMLLRMYVRWAEQHGFKVEYIEETAGRRGRHQIGDGRDQGPQRLWLAEDRERRASPGAHLAVRLQCAAAHVVCQRHGLSGGRRPHQDRHQGIRRARRYHARGRRRRPARQQDRIRGPPHAHSDQHRGGLPERPLAAPQSRPGLADAARQALRSAN